MATKIGNFTFDARPDRIDIRDREYHPPLRTLPHRYPSTEDVKKYLPEYSKLLILDQGHEGACTGFGLAAVINYLLWKQELEQKLRQDHEADAGESTLKRVSARMLYRMARVYDEWPGEDYEGSSCRGAMKGWHRHGVCTDEMWPYRTKSGQIKYIKPKDGWQRDAAMRPLGAYYRVNKDSIADMQAAVYEVGAIYVSAMVHDGWMNVHSKSGAPIIGPPKDPDDLGGHAFAIVGYSGDGFIVQNSWGKDWGFYGFAVMTYADWVQYGADAWVTVIGAPMRTDKGTKSARTLTSKSLEDQVAGMASWSWRSDKVGKDHYKNSLAEPWSETKAYEHTVVLENNGRPLNRYLDTENAEAAVKETVETMPLAWLRGKKFPKLAIYAHGGLNDEAASVKRARAMAPYFLANGIYPLFVTWRTGFLESIHGIIEDVVERFFGPSMKEPERGWISGLRQQIDEARDRSIEAASEKLLIKAVWIQMKQNAAAAAVEPRAGGASPAKSPAVAPGLVLLANHLEALKRRSPKLAIHLVGHSAGSILLGHLLTLLGRKKIDVSTLSLYAPACTVRFALDKYAGAVRKKILGKENIYLDILSDERERADSVGPYGKSLLYLVSRALEERHKMPLLGMEQAWKLPDKQDAETDMWHPDFYDDVEAWNKFAKTAIQPRVHSRETVEVADGHVIRLAHGSFDNDVAVVGETVKRIRGDGTLDVEVESLRGF